VIIILEYHFDSSVERVFIVPALQAENYPFASWLVDEFAVRRISSC